MDNDRSFLFPLLHVVELDSTRRGSSRVRFELHAARRGWRSQWRISMPEECANRNEEVQKRRITIDYLGSNEDQNVFHIGVRREVFSNGGLHSDQRCVRDNGHGTENIEGIVPTADVRSNASKRPLIDITVFECIRTKFKDVIHQCTDRHPRKDLISTSNRIFFFHRRSLTAENKATYPYCSKIVK